MVHYPAGKIICGTYILPPGLFTSQYIYKEHLLLLSGGLKGPVHELLFEKKDLIPGIQELIISKR
jgi:hypothetical protein